MSAPPAVSEVLFICTGNYYRSRFSEALFNHLAIRAGSGWRAFSRGVAIDAAPPGLSPHTRRALAERGVSLDHTPPERQSLTPADLERATLRIALKEAEHRAFIRRDFPAWDDRIDYWHFHDMDCATPEEMIPGLAERVTRLFESLASTEPAGQSG